LSLIIEQQALAGNKKKYSKVDIAMKKIHLLFTKNTSICVIINVPSVSCFLNWHDKKVHDIFNIFMYESRVEEQLKL
jgi:hypothetical protein